ncbi:hypothetical protein AB0C13_32075 [Streptomyces sp. NPDC049099]|uniref:hypothetical protein n=1 Tax=Streptomyces sp. NPDC049099 TaxID=3155768 RepID=UPI00343422B9
MPRSIDRILEQAAIPDTVTDDVLEDLRGQLRSRPTGHPLVVAGKQVLDALL